MKRVMNLVRLIFAVLLRDKIVLYIALAPALLSLIFPLVLGQAGSSVISFAVSSSAPSGLAERLALYGEVSILKTDTEVEKRVLAYDNAVGVVSPDGITRLVIEGNEGTGIVGSAESALSAALSGKTPDYDAKTIRSTGNIQMTMSMAGLLLFALFASASALGMNIVAERESRTIKATAISPARMIDYALAVAIATLVLALINSTLSIVMMRRLELLPQVLLLVLSSFPVGALIALILGASADNQISAIAAVKIIMPACLIIPVASYFVRDSLKPFFAWIPMYWQFEAILDMFSSTFNPMHYLRAFMTGTVGVVVLSPYLRKRFMLK